MSKAVEIIKSFLRNPSIKKILIAEDHLDYTPKEVLIELLDDIKEGKFICHKKIVFVMEHISVKAQERINEAVKNKIFYPDLEKEFWNGPFVEPKDLDLNMFVELAKRVITAGVPIYATENETTGYNSLITTTCLDRVRKGNSAVEEAFEAQIFQQDNVVAVFLGGAAHIDDLHPSPYYKSESIMGLKTALIENNDTVAIYISDEGGNFLNKNKRDNAPPQIFLEGFYGANNFDECISVKPTKRLFSGKNNAASNFAAEPAPIAPAADLAPDENSSPAGGPSSSSGLFNS